MATPLATPVHVGSAAMSAVHCVSASTNTRSKNSSSDVTRPSSRRTVVTCGRWVRAAVATCASSQVQGLRRGRRCCEDRPAMGTDVESASGLDRQAGGTRLLLAGAIGALVALTLGIY